MNKKIKKPKSLCVGLVCALIMTSVLYPITAKAYLHNLLVTTFSSPYNITVYYTRYYGSNFDFSNAVEEGKNAWNYSSAHVWFSPYYSRTNANVIIGNTNYGDVSWDGYCHAPSAVSPNHAKIDINEYWYYSSLQGNEAECVAHELGHALRLMHV